MDAKWIWLAPTTHPDMQRTFCTMLAPKEVRVGAPYGVAEFCRTVALREAPVRVRLRVSGDTVFRLWLNGRFVGEGPVCAGGDWLTFSALPWHFANRYTCIAAEKELNFFAPTAAGPHGSIRSTSRPTNGTAPARCPHGRPAPKPATRARCSTPTSVC